MCDQHHSTEQHLPRRNFLQLAAAAAVGSLLPGNLFAAPAADGKPTPTVMPAQALEKLRAGNRRFVTGRGRDYDFIPERESLVASQHPFASILACADSRVAPEIVFDQDLGELFVCRVAGNFADPGSIASFEYGAAVLGAPLILVLGHSGCGAIKATIDSVKKDTRFTGHIPYIIRSLRPAVEDVLETPGDIEANAVRQNVILTVAALRKVGPTLSSKVKDGSIQIVGGVYDLASGKVDFLV